MAEKDLKRLTGTPWHVGYVTKKENDPRRDKRVCSYYNEGHCNFHFGKCIGSSHCAHYKRNGAKYAKQKRTERWQAEVQQVSIPGVIQRGDHVTIRCRQTRETYSFDIAIGSDELAPIHQLCLGKKRGEQIAYSEYTYSIIDFVKKG